MKRWLGQTSWRVRSALAFIAALSVVSLLSPWLPPHSTIGSIARGGAVVIVAGTGGTAVAVMSGLVLGIAAAWGSVLADGTISWLTRFGAAFPGVVLVIVARRAWPAHTVMALMLSLALIKLPEAARLVRQITMQMRASESFLAARALGAGPWRLFWRHLLPYQMATLAQVSLFGVATLLLVDGAAGLMGLGLEDPWTSWGGVVAKSWMAGAPIASAVTAILWTMTLLALYALSSHLRRRLEPRLPGFSPLRTQSAGSK